MKPCKIPKLTKVPGEHRRTYTVSFPEGSSTPVAKLVLRAYSEGSSQTWLLRCDDSGEIYVHRTSGKLRVLLSMLAACSPDDILAKLSEATRLALSRIQSSFIREYESASADISLEGFSPDDILGSRRAGIDGTTEAAIAGAGSEEASHVLKRLRSYSVYLLYLFNYKPNNLGRQMRRIGAYIAGLSDLESSEPEKCVSLCCELDGRMGIHQSGLWYENFMDFRRSTMSQANFINIQVTV